ncbi:ubiquinone biosynthesis accessory factor UbiJ [Pollutimonas bauzanensis]|uniref:Ubiquinone biosynthesis accessory factor UbiJ n=1 Tax=Pollutimonas bauzanensis TaxID=658167 RepID=A0A1M5RAE5_9BURK|nr:SCP2 sterol-binding domain-containing protein [Pollutimonas bauzanensis]SHH22996.1 ubiquinone biosynthesis protein UbiJ [Pollutimonas bauzanensis]
MLSLPAFLAPTAVYARALNKLLRREDWARERLSRHSGKTARFVVGGLKMSLTVQAAGLVQHSDPAIVPDVILTIPAGKVAALPGALRARDPALITELMHIEGDAGLAQLVSDLARDLRWDVEEDLSGLVGDMAARRLLQAGRLLAGGIQASAVRLAGNVSEFLSEESGMMASRPAFEADAARLRGMLARLDQLDARVARLAGAGLRSPMRKA